MCIVYVEASYWLRQPTERVQVHLASELGVDLAPVPDAADPEATEVLPRVAPGLSDPPTDPMQTPAIPSTPRFQAGRPDQGHGEAEDAPAHQWWIDHGQPDADRWRFTVTAEGQRIELD